MPGDVPVKKNFFQTIVVLLLLGGAIALAVILATTHKKPEQVERAPVITPVQVTKVQPTDETIIITSYGTVEQTRQLKLQAEVKGRIIELHPNLNLGGTISEGERILRLDPSEYESAVKIAAAEVANAESELAIEQGRSWIAEKEFELLQQSIEEETLLSELGQQLVLRKPQAANRQAALEGTQGRLERAELDLIHTVIPAPFNAIVISEAVELGQVVSPGQTLATLVTSDYFVVLATLPLEQLHWMYERGDFPAATIFVDLGRNNQIQKMGTVERILPVVSKDGRMVRIGIVVLDPLDLQKPIKERQPLLLDSYVRVEIPGPTLKGVYRIPREAIRDGDLIWLMDENDTLRFEGIEILHSYSDFVLVSNGLQKGDRIITSRIALPVPGMPLREIEAQP
jgi:RND family efflux transporter MFP subunit